METALHSVFSLCSCGVGIVPTLMYAKWYPYQLAIMRLPWLSSPYEKCIRRAIFPSRVTLVVCVSPSGARKTWSLENESSHIVGGSDEQPLIPDPFNIYQKITLQLKTESDKKRIASPGSRRSQFSLLSSWSIGTPRKLLLRVVRVISTTATPALCTEPRLKEYSAIASRCAIKFATVPAY
ncbi:hypothetical protein EDD15DRAFT_2195851 [Pisolithus albus]|nr:hypothetical protein EDD15DRAFT_2195851 [Pisolithus albus]